MGFPFARGGTATRPFVIAVRPHLTLRLKPTRRKDCPQGITFWVRAGGVTQMGDYDVLPLGQLLRGLGFTLDDCREALDRDDDVRRLPTTR